MSKYQYLQISYVIALVLFLPLIVRGQDPQFSQFYAAPMYLNPAFTGNTMQGRVIANYRKQLLEVPGSCTSSSFSYDHFLRKYKSGLGHMVLKNKAGSCALMHNSIGGF